MNKINRETLELLTQRIREACYLTDAPYNIETAIEFLNGTVTQKILPPETDAFIHKTSDTTFEIVTNIFKSKARARFTLAHELGHLFLHMGFLVNEEKWKGEQNYQDTIFYRKSNIKKQEEYEANEFAASFLMPQEQFILIAKQHFLNGLYSTKPIADFFDVSTDAVKMRGKFLGIFAW